MKYRIRILSVSVALLLLSSLGYAQNNKPKGPSEEDKLNLTGINIESESARQLLKSDFIKVRKRTTDYMPEGELPVLKFENINDDICRQRLQKVIQRHSSKEVADRKIKERGEIMTAQLDTASFWISRRSGAYKFTECKNSMAIPTKIDHFKNAVQIALDYLGKNQLIELIDGEEVDILFVSAVKNVLTIVKEEDPKEEFISDYYVGFGRRFHDVPIIQSALVIRMNGKGEVVMIQKNWRQIVEVSQEKAVISSKSLPELIINNSQFHKRYCRQKVSPEDITIVDKKCGYLEAPINYTQEHLRPGCSVSFKIGESTAETYPQIFISLEDEVDKMCF